MMMGKFKHQGRGDVGRIYTSEFTALYRHDHAETFPVVHFSRITKANLVLRSKNPYPYVDRVVAPYKTGDRVPTDFR